MARHHRFLDYIFRKNQLSPVPAKRAIFYNIAQEIVHEINIMVERDGAEKAFSKIRIYEELKKSVDSLDIEMSE